jgi:hypothetical protein
MISLALVEEIKRRLKGGRLSQRKIARQLGVSRGTVNAIARGKRPDYGAHKEPSDGFVAPSGPAVRCPGCGGKVQMPCLACRLRMIRDDRQRGTGSPCRRGSETCPERVALRLAAPLSLARAVPLAVT